MVVTTNWWVAHCMKTNYQKTQQQQKYKKTVTAFQSTGVDRYTSWPWQEVEWKAVDTLNTDSDTQWPTNCTQWCCTSDTDHQLLTQLLEFNAQQTSMVISQRYTSINADSACRVSADIQIWRRAHFIKRTHSKKKPQTNKKTNLTWCSCLLVLKGILAGHDRKYRWELWTHWTPTVNHSDQQTAHSLVLHWFHWWHQLSALSQCSSLLVWIGTTDEPD